MQENEHFQLVKYGLYALEAHATTSGIVLQQFPRAGGEPAQPPRGDGLTIAYHGLNLGRVAAVRRRGRRDAADAGQHAALGRVPQNLRRADRQARAGPPPHRPAGRPRSSAATRWSHWCSWLIDQGYRGEMECIVAKIFGSEAQKEAAIELFMKTHGGRAFLHGHMFGDNVHEYLAPCIYEGEGEMLGMAFFKSLVKEHGKQYFEPIGKALHAAGIKQPELGQSGPLMKLAPAAMPWLKWRINEMVAGPVRAKLPSMPPSLSELAQFAADNLQRSRLEVDRLMQKHQLKLADRQCSMVELSQRIQSLIVMLTTCLWAAKQSDELVKTAAIVLGREIRRNITGKRPRREDFRLVTKLGADIAEGGFKALAGVESSKS